MIWLCLHFSFGLSLEGWKPRFNAQNRSESTGNERVSFPWRPATLAAMSDTLVVNEIYLSLQGESAFAGLPCVFIRLTTCNLRCSYCDTTYAFTDGKRQSLNHIVERVRGLAAPFREPNADLPPPTDERRSRSFNLPLVELTGGEPLLQPAVFPLMKTLCNDGFTVLLETSGAHDISNVDPRVHRIMDLKGPSSGELDRNRWENLQHLSQMDEIKFVLGTLQDYEWMKQQILAHHLAGLCPLLASWVHPLQPDQHHESLKPVPPGQTPLARQELVERILRDALPVRFQLQMHKIIWPPEQRGV